MCITDIRNTTLGVTKLCPSECTTSGCIKWSNYTAFKETIKKSNYTVKESESTVIKTLQPGNMIDYTGTGDNDSNCWVACMGTSKCVGYKWDGACTLYSTMKLDMTVRNMTTSINWMCGTDAAPGTTCSFDGLMNGDIPKLAGPNGTFSFYPDPSCGAFNCPNGIVTSTIYGKY
jgi:hypothetical protein